LIIGFQDTVENVGDVFIGTQCTLRHQWKKVRKLFQPEKKTTKIYFMQAIF